MEGSAPWVMRLVISFMPSPFSELLLPGSFHIIHDLKRIFFFIFFFFAGAHSDISILLQPCSITCQHPAVQHHCESVDFSKMFSACVHEFPCSLGRVTTGSGMTLEGGLGLLSQPCFYVSSLSKPDCATAPVQQGASGFLQHGQHIAWWDS